MISSSTISYINEITRLISVTIDDYLLTRKHFSYKYSYNTCLTMWILPRSEDIWIAKHGIVQTIVDMIHIQIVLYCVLACAVLADRVNGVCLNTGKLLWFPIYRSTS